MLTGGGDAPGLNAVIRAVVKSCCNARIECVGIEDGFDGLIHPDQTRPLTPRDVRGILRQGGTILGTTNRGNPFDYPNPDGPGTVDLSGKVVENFHALGLDALVIIGGDGTLGIAHRFHLLGIPVVGVPKTIDNDIVGTTNCFGFDTAVDFATDAIDRLHTTAEAHRRIHVVEVMGRNAGWIALYAGVAGGADAILIPELPFDLEKVATRLREREEWGAHFSIVVVAEGAFAKGESVSLLEGAHDGQAARIGGLGDRVALALGRMLKKEARNVVLGHLQRGGTPTSFDRVLATRFGGKAVELVRDGDVGTMVAFDPPDIVSRRLEDVVGRTRTVPPDSDLVRTAKAIGVTFGD